MWVYALALRLLWERAHLSTLLVFLSIFRSKQCDEIMTYSSWIWRCVAFANWFKHIHWKSSEKKLLSECLFDFSLYWKCHHRWNNKRVAFVHSFIPTSRCFHSEKSREERRKKNSEMNHLPFVVECKHSRDSVDAFLLRVERGRRMSALI